MYGIIKLSDEFKPKNTEANTLTDLEENPMQKVREDVVDQINSLIQSGLLQVDTIDVDGGFCYGLTEEGYKTAKQIEENKNQKKMDRATVFAAIEGERAYQDKMNEESEDKNKILPIEGELLLIDNYLQQAKIAYTGDIEGTSTREVIIRKIAAICVRCMEHHGTSWDTPKSILKG